MSGGDFWVDHIQLNEVEHKSSDDKDPYSIELKLVKENASKRNRKFSILSYKKQDLMAWLHEELNVAN